MKLAALAVAATAAVWLSSTSLVAQTAAARANAPIPRTPDGRPDLQGIYNVETITPVELIGVASVHFPLAPNESRRKR